MLFRSDLRAISSASFASLATAEVAALTTEQFASLTTDQIHALTLNQARALTTDQIVAFTTDQIVALTTADIAAMNMTQVSAFETEDIAVMSADQLNAFFMVSPVMLDLNGDGIHTSSAANGVRFDLNGTGHVAQYGWTDGTDGLLVMDRNGDGRINDGSELFGTGTLDAQGRHVGNGYAAMALEDSNHDGLLSSADAGWKELRVWVDANRDGVTDAGELKSLDSLGIASLDLKAMAGTEVDQGNLLGLEIGRAHV